MRILYGMEVTDSDDLSSEPPQAWKQTGTNIREPFVERSIRKTTMKEHEGHNSIHLILASTSPRRRDLLEGIGVRFRIVPPKVEETYCDGESPDTHVRRLALAKASEVSQRFPDRWILGGDTIVVIDGKILGKPDDPREAKSMLAQLSSRTHEVFSGYALVHSGLPHRQRTGCVRSSVRIRSMSAREIEQYVNTGEPMDKAGSYAIQGLGSAIVESVSGSYTNVVGLPICEVARELQDLGIFDFLSAASET